MLGTTAATAATAASVVFVWQETKALIESWQAKLQSEGAAYRPPDSRPAAEASAAAQQK